MDHDQFFFGAFHGYDLDGPAFGVVTKTDEPTVEYLRVSCGAVGPKSRLSAPRDSTL